MLTKAIVLREIPLRKWGGEYVPFKDFKDLKRVIESQKLSQEDLEFFRREIIARRALLPNEGRRKKDELGKH